MPPSPVNDPEHNVAASSQPQGRMLEYWKKNITLILSLLAVWATVSIGFGILLVKPLNAITFGQLPLGFWFAQQGAIYVFVILIIVYAVLMDKMDKEYDVHE
jgi:putative solute:sodium symporter small subunit